MKRFILFFITFLLMTIPVSHASDAQYFLIAGTDFDGFESEYEASAGGTEWGGNVTIFINDNPYKIANWGGFVETANHFLKEGQNTIRMTGSHTEDVYFTICKMDNYQVSKKMVKGIFEGSQTETTQTFSIDETLPESDFLGYMLPSEEETKTSVKSFLSGLFQNLQEGNFDPVAKLMAEPYKNDAYIPMIEKELKTYSDFIFSPWEDMTLVYGKNIIFVYFGFEKSNMSQKPFLYKYTKNNAEQYNRRVKFYFKNNTWHFLQ